MQDDKSLIGGLVNSRISHKGVQRMVAAVGKSQALREELLPLSPAQYAIWTHARVQPEKAAFYNLSFCFEVLGDVDLGLLTAALRHVVAVTASLRLQMLPDDGGHPVQRITHEEFDDAPVMDFSHFADPEIRAEAWVRVERQRIFDLYEKSLFRFRLLRLSGTRLWLFAHTHHLVTDGFGLGLIKNRIIACYSMLARREAVTLASDEALFRTYLRDSVEYLASPRNAVDGQFWAQMPVQAHPVSLSLRAEQRTKARPAVASTLVDLPAPVIQVLARRANEIGARFTQQLIALVLLYLHQASRSPLITVGLPVHGRANATLRDLVATCANVVPLSARLDGSETLLDWIGLIGRTIAEVLPHSQHRYEDIRSAVGRGRADPPLYNVVVNALPVPLLRAEFAGLQSVSRRATPDYVDDLSIWLFIAPDNSSIVVKLDGHPDKYRPWELEQHAENLVALFSAVAETHDWGLRITDFGRAYASCAPQPVSAASDPVLSVPALFSLQARATPDAIAIRSAELQLTYGQLEERANALATHLCREGVQTDDRVGLIVDRSPEMLIGMLGILKAGAAYLPLDLDYPAERLHYMLENAGVTAIVARDRQSLLATARLTAAVITTVLVGKHETQGEDPAPIASVVPDSLAYCMYTSGSTGRPKAVAVTHRGLLNHNLATRAEFRLTADDRVLQFASCSFDASVEEIFPTWLAGATLVVQPERLLAPREFLDLLQAEQVTVLNLPTAYWAALTLQLQLAGLSLPAALRLVIIGGEKATNEAARRWSSLPGADAVRCLNTYGPTEATVSCTIFEIGSSGYETDSVPIGRPLAGVQTHVLDEHLRLVPPGTVGELCLGGAGLARGYLNDEELTNENFVRDASGTRLYRTGDRVRSLPDGNLEFIGRRDDQVKLRGFRVHPGEVETALRRCTDVHECVVVASGDPVKLVAYISPVPSDIRAARLSLQRELSLLLPAYMMPAEYSFIPAMPLTVNGKVDRSALPASVDTQPSGREPADTIDSVSFSPTERALARMWSELLAVSGIRSDDSFLALGGDSLLAVALVGEVERRLGVDMPLQWVFRAPVLRDLAARLDRHKAGEAVEEEMDVVDELMAL